LKLDISKVYNHFRWLYLKEVMLKMEISPQWVKWIRMCVKWVDCFVILNNKLVDPIIPRTRLCQGNPLSTCLFILCVEGLYAIILKAEGRRDIHGVSIFQNTPIVFHLFFADDCFLFFRDNEKEAQMMKYIMMTYELVFGYTISLLKSEILL